MLEMDLLERHNSMKNAANVSSEKLEPTQECSPCYSSQSDPNLNHEVKICSKANCQAPLRLTCRVISP